VLLVHVNFELYTIMALCLNTLKIEIKTLESFFGREHSRFQIKNATVDEISCRFIGRNGKAFDIHANITVNILHISLISI
jgi:hypothetical protein